jgi:predicted MFS family arabinose efflux permease
MYTEKGVEGQNVGVGAVVGIVAAPAAAVLVAEIASSAKLLVAVVVVVIAAAAAAAADDFAGCVTDVVKLNSLKPVEC